MSIDQPIWLRILLVINVLTWRSISVVYKALVVGWGWGSFALESLGRLFVHLPINVSDGCCAFQLHVTIIGGKMLPLSLETKTDHWSMQRAIAVVSDRIRYQKLAGGLKIQEIQNWRVLWIKNAPISMVYTVYRWNIFAKKAMFWSY